MEESVAESTTAIEEDVSNMVSNVLRDLEKIRDITGGGRVEFEKMNGGGSKSSPMVNVNVNLDGEQVTKRISENQSRQGQFYNATVR
jgi:hypothetical protein